MIRWCLTQTNVQWMLILSIMTIIILTNLLELFTFWHASEITSGYLLNSIWFSLPLPGDWLISLVASESCFIRKPRVWFASQHILLPPAHCHFYFYFRAQGSLRLLIFEVFPHTQIYYLFLYKECVLGSKFLLENSSYS